MIITWLRANFAVRTSKTQAETIEGRMRGDGIEKYLSRIEDHSVCIIGTKIFGTRAKLN